MQVVVFAVAAMVAAEPEAEADASVFYGGYGYAAAPYALGYNGLGYAGYNAYGAYNGYAPRAYGWGYGAGYYGAGYGYAAGHYLGKREAEAEAAPEADAHVALAYNYAPYAYAPYTYAPYYWGPTGSSYQQISTPYSFQAVHQLHKRDAEADASVAYAYAPYAYATYPGVAVHPGLATSFEHRSPQGLGALYRPYGFYGNYYGYY